MEHTQKPLFLLWFVDSATQPLTLESFHPNPRGICKRSKIHCRGSVFCYKRNNLGYHIRHRCRFRPSIGEERTFYPVYLSASIYITNHAPN